MTSGMSAAGGSTSRLPALARIERSDDGRVVAGVCAGIGRAVGVDPGVIRLAFAVLAVASGSGIVLYLGAWAFLPAPTARPEPRGAAARTLGFLLLVAGAFLAMRGLGLASSLLIPATLIALGVVLVARRAGEARRVPQLLLGSALVIVGTTVYVNESGPFGDGGPLAPGAVAIALVAILAPWLWQLARERDAERLQRIRTQERADVAARVHDSVLQTLALIQRHADDPRRIATLARQQERELRGWLYGGAGERGATLVAAVERAASEVEQLQGVRIDVVSAGDAPLDERLDALALAARESMTNAAKFSGAETVSVYVEAGQERASVFVRDRGIGFDRAAIPPDRHGIRESIERRLERHEGSATITAAPGAGTEIELTMPRSEP